MISVHLPLKTVAGLNAREHWRKRAKRVKAERLTARLVLTPHPKPDVFPVVVRMVRLSPGTLDSDNLQGAAKAIRDGVADWLGIPDNDPRIDWQYGQERCKRGEFGVRVEVLPPANCAKVVNAAGDGFDWVPVESLGRP